jgi:hypothetical protein
MPPASDEPRVLSARLDRIKKLTDKRLTGKTDTPETRALRERISCDLDAARAAIKALPP